MSCVHCWRATTVFEQLAFWCRQVGTHVFGGTHASISQAHVLVHRQHHPVRHEEIHHDVVVHAG